MKRIENENKLYEEGRSGVEEEGGGVGAQSGDEESGQPGRESIIV
jgi:hypothetical protein